MTEPLEFSFMFVAPVLYVLHAFLTGVSVYIAASMQWIAGFGFSAGLVDMVLSSRNPLAKDWFMLLGQGAVFFAVYYFAFRAAITAMNLKTPGREDEIIEEIATPESAAASAAVASGSTGELAMAYVTVVGGASNVTNVDACITRLRLSVVDADLVNEAAAKSLGASGVIKLNKQSVQIIVGPKAELIADALRIQLASSAKK
ncbi:glucose PTS transporter subunit EIIB [Deefgea sp. CFH1-16]|uniref:glucose PTS transporter subunit EIIB n=1 Tax=Deefgea sp. CFH1-16 TaxID=2675457 RepID=UPI0019403223|nr:glucose PTS transporter subunit EIIB [Deefgea sp. CFH1-16]